MPRQARLKILDAEGCYHAWNAAACRSGEYPLAVPYVRHRFMALLKFYLGIYFCKLAAHSVMGNHFHLVLRFDAPRPLSQDQLTARARKLYPGDESIETWPQKRWKAFEKRLFDISKFMGNLEQAFSTWYNRLHSRKGTFWAARYKSSILGGPQAFLDAVTYVELNGVRAGLVARPEEYQGGSLYLREAGEDAWLMPLSEILPDEKLSGEALHARFKERCYYRGAVISRPGQKPISAEVIKQEKARGFKRRGVFRKRLRCFTDGLVLGSELYVLGQLAKLRELGRYVRRKNAVKQLEGALFSLREQRSSFVET